MTSKIPYFIVGDPDLNTTYDLLLETSKYSQAIALAFPFSDPMAASPLTQKAHVRALENLFHTKDIFKMLESFKEVSGCPLIVELYYNQIFSYGIADFFHDAKKAGIQALIVLDLPVEHEDEILPYAKHQKITLLHHLSSSLNRSRIILPRSQEAVICLNETSAQLAKETGLYRIQEIHQLDDQIFGDVLIMKEPFIDLVEALGMDINAKKPIQHQIKALLTY